MSSNPGKYLSVLWKTYMLGRPEVLCWAGRGEPSKHVPPLSETSSCWCEKAERSKEEEPWKSKLS